MFYTNQKEILKLFLKISIELKKQYENLRKLKEIVGSF